MLEFLIIPTLSREFLTILKKKTKKNKRSETVSIGLIRFVERSIISKLPTRTNEQGIFVGQARKKICADFRLLMNDDSGSQSNWRHSTNLSPFQTVYFSRGREDHVAAIPLNRVAATFRSRFSGLPNELSSPRAPVLCCLDVSRFHGAFVSPHRPR